MESASAIGASSVDTMLLSGLRVVVWRYRHYVHAARARRCWQMAADDGAADVKTIDLNALTDRKKAAEEGEAILHMPSAIAYAQYYGLNGRLFTPRCVCCRGSEPLMAAITFTAVKVFGYAAAAALSCYQSQRRATRRRLFTHCYAVVYAVKTNILLPPQRLAGVDMAVEYDTRWLR